MFTLRPVTMDDALDLVQWKNDSLTRNNALESPEIIMWNKHLAWLEKRLQKPGFYLITEGQEKCGWIRFDIEDEIEVAIVIAPKHRGRGIAGEVVGIVSSMIQMLHNKTLYAKIVDGNTASFSVFTKAGFIPVDHYEKNGKGYSVLKKVA